MPSLMIDREVLIEAPVDVVWRTITETGHELRAWPDEEKQRYAAEHQEGWGDFLDRLATVAAKQ